AANTGSASTGAAAGEVDQAGAKEAVDAARGVPKFTAPGPAFDAAPAKGKVVALVPDYPSLPFVQEINTGLKAAASQAGITLKDCANDGTVGGWVKCFNQALAMKPDAIVLNGSPSPSQLQPQIKKANAAKIPVIANHVPLDKDFPDGTLPATNTTGIDAVQPGPFPLGAKLMADYAVAEDGADVNALIITANEAPASKGMVKMIQDELAAKCGSCKTTVLNVPIVDWATKLQGETRTALVRDPKINWVMPVYDGAMSAIVPGIKSAQRSETVKLTGFNGQGFALNGIAEGTVTSTMGENLEWTGWSTIDRTLRVLTGQEPTDVLDTPVRVWDKSNITDAGTPPEPTKGYGEYQGEYLKLWGIGA
ncbi:MAG: sugar ABC transporter substrate-binding protein, partial [Solirubrobacteraceae bacterium]|nr:sugar ABC transporter substrate-binding protein [Solirubrobacteraceae bacterium]